MLSKNKRTEQEHLQDLDRIAHLYLRGYSFGQIATTVSEERKYSINKTQVARDIAKIRQMWIENATAAYSEAIGRELAKVDALEKEYWDGYDKANGNKTMSLREVVKDNDGVRDRQLKKVTEQGGLGTEFLKGIQWCIEKRLELLGIQTGNRSLTISWQEEAKKDGIDKPDELFEKVVATLMDNMKNNQEMNFEKESENIIDGLLVSETEG
jgi:hypothetical protein